MTEEKIYIQLLDGSTSFVPVNATKLSDNQYEILDDKEFTEYVDFLYVHEFYPSDIVELGQHRFNDGSTGLVAKKLISAGKWPDRKLNEFKFKGVLGEISIDKQSADKYSDEINKIIRQKSAGQFIYPVLLETIDKLVTVTKK
ncbi:MAG: hypothetical protein KA713_09765 [Chryseotalea sp. WA131a]|nr:MAG: hypothetical protein KA713_09765 [Chryseotalea sp. WA131a]